MKVSYIALAIVMVAGAARADVKYTMTQRMPDYESKKNLKTFGRTTTLIKAGAQRTESESNFGAYKMQDVSYIVCADKQRVRLDDNLKIYTVAPLQNNTAETPPSSTQNAPKPAKPSKTSTGKVSMTVTVQTLEPETIAKLKARHYMITQNIVTTGCAGDANLTSKMEIWVADYKLPVFDCSTTGYDWTSAYGGGKNNCNILFELKGDVEAFNAAFRGLMVKQRMFDEKGNIVMESELTELSEAKLDDKPFSIPAGYKKVSDKEFDELRNKAMMSAMMKGAGGAGRKDDDDDASPETEPQDDDSAVEEAGEQILKEKAKQEAGKKFKLPF
jgi:hypothetical protein